MKREAWFLCVFAHRCVTCTCTTFPGTGTSVYMYTLHLGKCSQYFVMTQYDLQTCMYIKYIYECTDYYVAERSDAELKIGTCVRHHKPQIL